MNPRSDWNACFVEMERLVQNRFEYRSDDALVLDPFSQLLHCLLSQRSTSLEADEAFDGLLVLGSWDRIAYLPQTVVADAIRACRWPERKAAQVQAAIRRVGGISATRDMDFLHAHSTAQALAYLMAFVGIGMKTGCRTLLFSTLRRAVFPVDTHGFRILFRMGLLCLNTPSAEAHRRMRRYLRSDMTVDEVEALYMGVKRVGQQYCRPKFADCGACPLKSVCEFRRRPRQLALAF